MTLTPHHPRPLARPRRSRGRHGPRHLGFTLVELLVVIGIIALLIAMLMPTLSRSREAANMTACMSNLRQIGMAFQQYRNDNRDILPARFAPWNSARWQWVVQQYVARNDFSTDDPARQHAIFRCVSQGDNFHNMPSDGRYRISYAINFLGSDGTWDHWGRYYWLRGSKVNNSTFHYLADINPSWYPWHYSFTEDVSWMLAFRHAGNRYANFLFLDGHVQSMTRTEYLANNGVFGSYENQRRLGF
ncbi:MAG: type II secretion system protein [Tepidisphaerales bacterium]